MPAAPRKGAPGEPTGGPGLWPRATPPGPAAPGEPPPAGAPAARGEPDALRTVCTARVGVDGPPPEEAGTAAAAAAAGGGGSGGATAAPPPPPAARAALRDDAPTVQSPAAGRGASHARHAACSRGFTRVHTWQDHCEEDEEDGGPGGAPAGPGAAPAGRAPVPLAPAAAAGWPGAPRTPTPEAPPAATSGERPPPPLLLPPPPSSSLAVLAARCLRCPVAVRVKPPESTSPKPPAAGACPPRLVNSAK